MKARDGLAHWLEKRGGQWQDLADALARRKDRRDAAPAEVLGIVQGFRGLSRDLSLARGVMPEGRVTRYLERLFAQAHETIYREPRNLRADFGDLWRRQVPQVVREIRGAILGVHALFVLSLLLGWLLVFFNPELAALFASPEMIRTVQGGELWTDGLLNILPSSVLALSIIANNVTVSLFAFSLGVFYGLGTLYIIVLNGLMIGGIFAFTGHYGLDGRLFEFVIAHGIVELSVICLAGAAGLLLGEALIRPGQRPRAEAFRHAVSQAGKLLGVAIPFLVGAGLIEGYISPDPAYPLPFKIAVGVAYGVLFWLVLSGRGQARVIIRSHTLAHSEKAG
jgi:uncharacterized membrane protein SpoIIM required for sporulation